MPKKPSGPLSTRHVFLDTEVFRKLRYNPGNPALRALAKHVDARHVVLHTTDITLAEAKRHIREEVAGTFREIDKAERSLMRWRHHDKALAELPKLKPRRTAEKVFEAFSLALTRDLGARLHNATAIPAVEIFKTYFAREAPFDREASKEFPDAFMVLCLEKWCAENAATMYVVTRDKAMLRAVDQAENLVGLETIEAVLAGASTQPDYDENRLAEEIMAAPEIDAVIEEAILAVSEELVFIYYGDLPEGEVIDQELGGIEIVSDYSVAWLGEKTVCLILTIQTNVYLELEYEDRTLAMYDREDDIWFGADIEHKSMHQDVALEIFVELELDTRKLLSAELLRTDYYVTDDDRDL